jgi:hypothetical protein
VRGKCDLLRRKWDLLRKCDLLRRKYYLLRRTCNLLRRKCDLLRRRCDLLRGKCNLLRKKSCLARNKTLPGLTRNQTKRACPGKRLIPARPGRKPGPNQQSTVWPAQDKILACLEKPLI